MAKSSDFLREEYTIETPENVAFGYEVAGIGSRFIGALIDTVLLTLALIAITLLLLLVLGLTNDLGRIGRRELLGEGASWAGGLVIALYALLNFGLTWGYYLIFELIWNGQTPGKRAAGIRVLRTDGNAAGAIEIAIRNLVRIVDFLPFGYALGLMVMFFNRQARRLGDFAAGTLVVKERRDITLASLRPAGAVATTTGEAGTDRAPETLPSLRALSAADYDLIEEALERRRRGMLDEALLARLAGAIAAKIACPAPAAVEARPFLEEIARRYRGQADS